VNVRVRRFFGHASDEVLVEYLSDSLGHGRECRFRLSPSHLVSSLRCRPCVSFLDNNDSPLSASPVDDVPFHSLPTIAGGFVFDPGGDVLCSSSSEFNSECTSTIDNVWNAGWCLPLIADADESIVVFEYGESSPVCDESIATSASAFEHKRVLLSL